MAADLGELIGETHLLRAASQEPSAMAKMMMVNAW
jgi:hypothetical protein